MHSILYVGHCKETLDSSLTNAATTRLRRDKLTQDHQSYSSLGNPETKGTLDEAFEVIVFDCDGVLFDSKQANIHFYNHILEKFGHSPVQPHQHEYIHMHPVLVSLRFLLNEEQAFQEAWEYCRNIDFGAFHRYLSCEPGLVDLLESLKESYHIALATNRTVSTHEVLAHFCLDKYFDLVVSASDVEYPKPHPESMEVIMRAFNALPQKVLYIGDSQVDESLASATGVWFVAYKNRKLKAHMHISHFEELRSVLTQRQ